MNTEHKSKAYLQSPRVVKRNLKGINGSRFYNIPGVIYPESVLKVKPGYNPQTGKPYEEKPAWGISSAEAGAILQCSASAARISLRKHRVRFHIVQAEETRRQLYWSRTQVEKLAASRLPIAGREEQGLVNMGHVAEALGVTRTTLQRYCKRGLLHPIKRRVRTHCGLRESFFFTEAEVERLSAARERWQSSGSLIRPLEDFMEQAQQEGR